MTATAPSIAFDHSTDAAFRTWGLALSTALAAVGLVKTADAQQPDWTTAVRPALNTAVYEYWRFSDALQSTKPVFLRVGYGTGGNVSWPLITIQIGSGTSGAGGASALTGVTTAAQFVTRNAVLPTAAVPCFISSDGSYLNMALVLNGTTNQGYVLSIDRTRNADGSPNGDGLYAVIAPNAGSGQYAVCNTLIWAQAVTAKAWKQGTNAAFPSDPTTAVVGADTLTFPHLVYAPYAEAPALACLAGFQADATAGTLVVINHLGANHTYVACGNAVYYMGWYDPSYGYGNGNHSIYLRHE